MGEKRQLAVNMIAGIISFGVQFGVSFVLTPYIVRTLGSEAYGFIPLANQIVGYTTIVTTALNSMASRFISIEMNRENTKQANIYFNSVLISNIILALIFTIPSILIVLFANHFLDIPENILTDVQITFALSFASMVMMLIFNVFSVVYYVRNRLDLSSKRNVEGNIIRAVVLVALFVFLQPHIFYVTATMFIVNIYLCATNIHYTRKMTPELSINPKAFSQKAVKTLLSSGVWNSVNQLSTTLMTTLDLLLMNMFVGAGPSGQYSLVKTLPNMVQQIASVMVGVFVPMLLIDYAKNKKQQLVDDVRFSVQFLGAIITIPLGFLMVFGVDFFHIWVPTQDAQLLQELSILTLIPLIVTTSLNTVYNVYTVTNKLKTPALVWLALGILNVVVVVALLKFTDLGIWVIPIVSLIMGLARNLTFTPVYAAHCLGLRWHTFYAAIFRGCLCVCSVIAVSLVYRSFFIPQNWPQLIIAAIVCGGVALVGNVFIAFEKNKRARFITLLASKFHLPVPGQPKHAK